MGAGRFREDAHQQIFDEGWKGLVRAWGQTGSEALDLRSLGTFLRESPGNGSYFLDRYLPPLTRVFLLW
jgi:hypothetical protein